jgi:hypothetical protein
MISTYAYVVIKYFTLLEKNASMNTIKEKQNKRIELAQWRLLPLQEKCLIKEWKISL